MAPGVTRFGSFGHPPTQRTAEEHGLEMRRAPSDSMIRYFLQQVGVADLCTTIRKRTIVQIPDGAADLVQLA